MSQSSYFKSRPDLLTLEGKPEISENAYKYLRYVIDVTGLDLYSLVELGGGVQRFGEFGASGRARTMKIGRRVRELHKLTNKVDKVVFTDSIICGADGIGKIKKIEVFLTGSFNWILMFRRTSWLRAFILNPDCH